MSNKQTAKDIKIIREKVFLVYFFQWDFITTKPLCTLFKEFLLILNIYVHGIIGVHSPPPLPHPKKLGPPLIPKLQIPP